MKELLYRRLENILTIKSLVTLTATAVFAALTLMGRLDENFMTIYSVIIAFYFGTQAARESAG